jgi:hypothetical protein
MAMNKTTMFAIAVGLGLVVTPAAHGWISYLDGSQLPEDIPGNPWTYYERPDDLEGTVQIFDLGGGNMALRFDSPEHFDGENPGGTGEHANEYYTFRDEMGAPTENVIASRFRLVAFTPTGKENLLSTTINSGLDEDGDGQPDGISTSPAITLVDGNFWVWSYTTNEQVLDLGPAVAGQFHEAYVMARNDGTAQVWWDGVKVLDGPVPATPNFGDYAEFGSGTSWQTTAGTTVDFDWVGWGEISDMPQPPSLVGDYNNNGRVDAADYVAWRENMGTMNTLPNDPLGGTIGQGQYVNWRAHFGEVNPQAAQGIGTVPEPHTTNLLIVGVVAGIVARRASFQLARQQGQLLSGGEFLIGNCPAGYTPSWPDGRIDL